MSRVYVYIRVATTSQISDVQEISPEKKALVDRMLSDMMRQKHNRIDTLLDTYQFRHGCKVE